VFALVGLLTLDFITPLFPLAAVTGCLYNTFVMAQKFFVLIKIYGMMNHHLVS